MKPASQNMIPNDTRQLQQLLRIGTARARYAAGVLAAPLDGLLPPAQTAPEATLWLSLGALDVWERAGHVPHAAAVGTPDDTMPPCPAERLRPCPDRAEAILAALLRGLRPPDLLGQWLQQLAHHGARLPARFLPALLDLATRQAALRARVTPVLGERGRWLARTEEQWHWAQWDHAQGPESEPDRALWETGSLQQRIDVLRIWRMRDPAAARAALAQAWPAESPEQRAALLSVLALGLGPDDEPFLEEALDDRRKEVRSASSDVLVRLPGAGLSRRMAGRLLPLLRIESAHTGKAHLEIGLPAACDAAMRRDGVGAGHHPGLGEKSGWVADMLAAVAPPVWSRHLGLAPRDCLSLAARGESAHVLLRGWALALMRAPQESEAAGSDVPADGATNGTDAWLRDFALWWTGAATPLRNAVPDGLFDTFGIRFAANRGGALDALLDALPEQWKDDPALLQMLCRLADESPASWPSGPTGRMLRRLDAAVSAIDGPAPHWLFGTLLDRLARILDPATASAFEAGWNDRQPETPWRNAFDKFFDIVRFRHEMTLSFQEQA